jgi:hypothetical protein
MVQKRRIARTWTQTQLAPEEEQIGGLAILRKGDSRTGIFTIQQSHADHLELIKQSS